MTASNTSPAFEAVPRQTETISHNGQVLCLFIRPDAQPERTAFYTSDSFQLQVGTIVYPAGGAIPRHTHRPVERRLVGTPEVLIVQKGRVLVEVFTEARDLLCTREAGAGDIVVLLSGGHGFQILEDTVLLEVKQGPYAGLQEKDRF